MKLNSIEIIQAIAIAVLAFGLIIAGAKARREKRARKNALAMLQRLRQAEDPWGHSGARR